MIFLFLTAISFINIIQNKSLYLLKLKKIHGLVLTDTLKILSSVPARMDLSCRKDAESLLSHLPANH